MMWWVWSVETGQMERGVLANKDIPVIWNKKSITAGAGELKMSPVGKSVCDGCRCYSS